MASVISQLDTLMTGVSSIGVYSILSAGSSGFSNMDAGNVYWDSVTRARRAPKEVLLIYGLRNRVKSITGRRTSTRVVIELFMATNDLVLGRGNRYDEALEQAAFELLDAYDQQEYKFNQVLSQQVDQVACVETSSVDMSFGDREDPRTRFFKTLELEVIAWET